MIKTFLKNNLPSVVTLLSLCFGMSSIKLCLEGEYGYSIACTIFAAIADGLDGKLARYLNACSEFGAQLDSLCDMVNFGIAPIFIIYIWRLNELNILGWCVVLYSSCSIAVRLARFNSTPKEDEYEKQYVQTFFVGVPSTVASLLYLLPLIIELETDFKINTKLIFLYELLVSTLCMSRIPTFSNKSFKFRNQKRRILLVVSIVFAYFAFHHFMKMLIVVGLIYYLTIPFAVKKYFDFRRNYEEKISKK